VTPAALEWITRFRRYLTSERRFSRHTDSNYARDLAALVAYCDHAGLEDWSKLTSHTIRHFAARQHASGLAPRSIQRRLSGVRSFYSFLLREGLPRPGPNRTIESCSDPGITAIKSNPGREVQAPKAARKLPGTLDPDSMTRLLEIPPNDDDELATRDRAIMELFYSSGLRLAELVGLDVDSLQPDRTVRVVGKGRKERIVPVGRKAADALARWLEARAALAKPGERALFLGRNGKRLGGRAVQLRVAHWARVRGLSVAVHPHLFRHSFATHVLESSQDLRGVQEMLGHASLATTQVYTHLDFQHLARIYEASHPRARRKSRT
jgi:integrase/recombinase XerC